jgi:hypothetical protein
MITMNSVYEVLHDSFAVNFIGDSTSQPLILESAQKTSHLIETAGFLMSQPSQSWYFYFLMMLIAGYAITRIYLGELLNRMYLAAAVYNRAADLYKDNSQLQRQRDFALYGFYFLSLGFFLMYLSDRFGFNPYQLEDYRLFIFYVILLVTLFYGRGILLNLLGYLFSIGEIFREYLYMGYAYNKLIGILLIPVNFVLVFSKGILQESLFFITLLLLGVLIFKKLIRGIIFSRKHRVFNFYLFLYLCALEIVPILLLYKWFTTIG